jgi:hypothetical protein
VCKEQFSLTTEDPDDQVIVTLPCKHPFHEGCIMPWLKSSGTCPVCRYGCRVRNIVPYLCFTGSNWCHSLSITHPHLMARPVGLAVPGLGLRSIEGQGPTLLKMGVCSATFSVAWVVVAMVAVRGLTGIHLHARSGSTRIFLVHGWTSPT